MNFPLQNLLAEIPALELLRSYLFGSCRNDFPLKTYWQKSLRWNCGVRICSAHAAMNFPLQNLLAEIPALELLRSFCSAHAVMNFPLKKLLVEISALEFVRRGLYIFDSNSLSGRRRGAILRFVGDQMREMEE